MIADRYAFSGIAFSCVKVRRYLCHSSRCETDCIDRDFHIRGALPQTLDFLFQISYCSSTSPLRQLHSEVDMERRGMRKRNCRPEFARHFRPWEVTSSLDTGRNDGGWSMLVRAWMLFTRRLATPQRRASTVSRDMWADCGCNECHEISILTAWHRG